jgi:plasmid stabilization system protein ParE
VLTSMRSGSTSRKITSTLQTVSLISSTRGLFSQLDNPLGRARLELAPNLRSLLVGDYVMFYRPIDDGIEVVRVLHGARDIDAMFEG